jgi:hypothetical protein
MIGNCMIGNGTGKIVSLFSNMIIAIHILYYLKFMSKLIMKNISLDIHI